MEPGQLELGRQQWRRRRIGCRAYLGRFCLGGRRPKLISKRFQTCGGQLRSAASVALERALALAPVGIPVACPALACLLQETQTARLALERKCGVGFEPREPRHIVAVWQRLVAPLLIELVDAARGRPDQCIWCGFWHRLPRGPVCSPNTQVEYSTIACAAQVF